MIFNKLKAIFSKPNPMLSMAILELDPTVRTYNVLKRAGIDTVGDLTEMSWNDLASVRRMNRRGILEIEGLLKGIGLKLREENNNG
jgi:DNA-directed RNA polymerase subunit alpha